jgi:CBS domain-containing protein
MAWPTIAELMTHTPITVRADLRAADARTLMRERGVRHLPVEGDPPGLVALHDLDLADDLADLDRELVVTVGDVMRRAIVVPTSAYVTDVLARMDDAREDAVVVADDGVVVGIFTAIDGLRALRRMLDESRGEASAW